MVGEVPRMLVTDSASFEFDIDDVPYEEERW